jgi:hypothetical protein
VTTGIAGCQQYCLIRQIKSFTVPVKHHALAREDKIVMFIGD